MSDNIVGYDRYTISTPADIRRGSDCVLRRTVYIYDHDQAKETKLDISSASDIVWHLLTDFKKATSPVLKKTFAASQITKVGSHGYDVTLSANDTKNLTPGLYWAAAAIVIGGKRYKFAPYRVNLQPAGALGE